MPCRYCRDFVESDMRLTPKNSDGEKSKYEPVKRRCAFQGKFVTADTEECDQFKTSNNFWCDKLQQCMDIDACMNSRKKKLRRQCKTCSQYYDVLDALRMRSRDTRSEKPTPTLIRRKKDGPE